MGRARHCNRERMVAGHDAYGACRCMLLGTGTLAGIITEIPGLRCPDSGLHRFGIAVTAAGARVWRHDVNGDGLNHGGNGGGVRQAVTLRELGVSATAGAAL